MQSAGAPVRASACARAMAQVCELSMEGHGHVDKTDKAASRWGWLPAAMPGVARLMAEKRRELGNEHVHQCWRRGVLEQQPGWFFAREGALAVGTPWAEVADVAWTAMSPTQAIVVLRPARGDGGGDGA